MKDERHVRQRRAAGARWRPAAILLAAVLVFLSLPLAGRAADVTPGVQNGTLQVVPSSDAEMAADIAVNNANLVVDVYRIADAQPVSGFDTFSWEKTAPFASVDIPNSPDASNDEWESAAQKAASLVLGVRDESEWDPSSAVNVIKNEPGDLVKSVLVSHSSTGGEQNISDISAKFTGENELPAGMFLILAHSNGLQNYARKTAEGKYVTVADSDHYEYLFKPELITIPTKEAETWEGQTESRINTANRGPWLFDVKVWLKPEREERKGNLAIIKNLKNYEVHEITSLPNNDGEMITTQVADDATFVFEVKGYPSKENYDSDSPTVTYHDFVSIVFKGADSNRVLINDLPVGTYVKVEEVYSGKKYTIDDDEFTVIKANQTAEVEFDNEYDDKPGGGGSVTNKFSYDENNGWQLKQGAPDNSENAGEDATVKSAPTSDN